MGSYGAVVDAVATCCVAPTPGIVGTPGIGVFGDTAVAVAEALGAASDETLTWFAPVGTPVAARFEADGEAAGSSPAGVTA